MVFCVLRHFVGKLEVVGTQAKAASISGLVVEYVVAIDVTRVRFPADAFFIAVPLSGIAMFVAYLVARHRQWSVDTLAEWLRRRPAKPVGSAREGSNPSGVVFGSIS